jgi:uncharacterized protein with GYD domain
MDLGVRVTYTGAPSVGFSDSGPSREEVNMPLFVRLVTFTEQGSRNIKSSSAILGEVKKVMEANGVKLLHAWATLGAYDAVSVVEAKDSETMAKVSALITAMGNHRSVTLAAVPFEQFAKSIG